MRPALLRYPSYLLQLVLVPVALACATSVATSSAPTDAGGFDSSAPSDDASSRLPDASLDAGSASDAPVPSTKDAEGIDGGSSKGHLDPNPPAGSTKCGSGTLTQSDMENACKAVLFPITPLLCVGGVETQGADWEAWCSATTTYLHVHFKGMTVGAELAKVCPANPVSADQFILQYPNGASTVATYPAQRTLSATQGLDIAVSQYIGPLPKGNAQFIAYAQPSGPGCLASSFIVLSAQVHWDTGM